ncbi:hypothetical protein MLD38_032067 [Melastoma candidum]|uniref:Uncharacterized protein n=1 Tax=Melastoma candidum TaxID=119954 RepID=A0ACB9M355_9MYRT|nr:hypothetical protein MLD38_032067 [Melastoma candidum]
MNRTTLPEASQCVNPAGNHFPDMTVLERKCQLQLQQHQGQGSSLDYFVPPGLNTTGAFCMTSQGSIVADSLKKKKNNSSSNLGKLDQGVYSSWPDFGGFGGNYGWFGNDTRLLGVNYGTIMNTSVPLPQVAAAGRSMEVMAEEKVKGYVLVDQKSSRAGDESLGKRKFNILNNIKTDNGNGEKEMEEETEKAESKVTAQSNHACKSNKKETNSKEKAKNSEVTKTDYIHVRARRGQATDSHSLAERARREKISERMKFLQDLVPGCNKITGKAGMLDEIINYVQSLQRQVEFLSMKLAVANPRLDLDIDTLFAKESTLACAPNFPSTEMLSDLSAQAFLHFNPASQLASPSGAGSGVNPNPGIWRTISAPLPATEKFLSSFTQTQVQSATWDDMSLQNLYNVEFQPGRTITIPGQLFTGSLEASDMKIGM